MVANQQETKTCLSEKWEKRDEEQLVRENIPLVVSQVLTFTPNHISGFDDCVQVGCIGLLRAIRTFKAELGNKFSTYAVPCIRHEIIKELRKHKLDLALSVDVDMPPQKLDQLWENISVNLDDNELQILELRAAGYTFQEIGKKLGYSDTWANNKMHEVIERLQELNNE